jgi:hypothetical protein
MQLCAHADIGVGLEVGDAVGVSVGDAVGEAVGDTVGGAVVKVPKVWSSLPAHRLAQPCMHDVKFDAPLDEHTNMQDCTQSEAGVGATLGAAVGACVGASVGACVGEDVGAAVSSSMMFSCIVTNGKTWYRAHASSTASAQNDTSPLVSIL